MPEYRYADHGSVTPYLSLYPGLFDLYGEQIFVSNKPKPKPMAGAQTAPRRASGLRWVSSQSRFSSPTSATSRASSGRSSAPYLYTFYDDESSVTSPLEGVSPTRLAKPVVVDVEPPPRRERKRRATLDREPSSRSSKRERSSSSRRDGPDRRRSYPHATDRPTFFVDRDSGYIAPRISRAEPVTTYVDASPCTPPQSSRRGSAYASPPINPTPPQPLRRRGALPLPRATPLAAAADAQPAIYVQRRNAVRRDGKPRAVPLTQTDPAIPMPELTKLDKLLDQLSLLVAASSNAVPPSTRAPAPLPRDLQAKLCDLAAYAALDAATLLPDQDAPAARWHSSLRLFPGIRGARDRLAPFDGLRMNPPRGRTQRDAAAAARWRALQRVSREPHTAPKKALVPSLVALVAAQSLARHVLALVEAKARDIGNPYRAKAPRDRRVDPARMHSGMPRRRAHTAPSGPAPRVVASRWDPEGGAGAELGMPTPLALRVRRLERIDLRIQRVLARYAAEVWRVGDGGAWLAWVRDTMAYEGFLVG